MNQMDKTKFKVGKTCISRTNPDDAFCRITEAAFNGLGGYICVSNLRTVLYAGKDKEYRKLMEDSFMNLPDGTPLSWCGKVWGLKDVSFTNGPALFKKMMNSGDNGLRHFLIGDTQDVLDEIVQKYQVGKGTRIVGVFSPPFAPLEEYDLKGMAKMIEESGANIVWSAMTAPKQDFFDQQMSRLLPNILFIGVGRAFRISIDKVKEAPYWAQKSGLGGLFISKKKPLQRVWSDFRRSFILAGFCIKILFRRIIGKKYYE